MVENRDFYLASADGEHQLHVQEWLPEGEPRAVLQLVHGINEYVGRYDRFARWMAEHGFYVVGDDHLGHGKTARDETEQGFTSEENGWKYMVEDIRRVRVHTGATYPQLPYILMGHSMGSFLTRTYLIAYPGTIDACILSGTGLNSTPIIRAGLAACRLERRRLGPHGRSKLLKKLAFGAYNNQFKPIRTENDWISRDTDVVDRYCADPDTQFAPTVTLFGDMLGGLYFLSKPENLVKMDKETPVYFFSGDADPVGECGKGVRKVYNMFCQAGCRNVELKLYPGGRHEMLNEINYPEVYQDVLAWIEKTIFPENN